MFESLFECTSFKLGCDAQYNNTWSWTHFRWDICLFFEKGIRSGFSYISKRHSKLKKRYLKSYDPKQKSNHITYLETNNLYDYAMLKILPTGGFK